MEKKVSRDSWIILILGTSLFILSTVLFMEYNAVAEGYTTIGFPVTFYRYTEAETSNSVSWQFQPGYILINYLIALSVSILVIEGIKKIRKQKPV